MNSFITDTALFIAGQGYFLLFLILMISRREQTTNMIMAAFIAVQATKIFTFYLAEILIHLPWLLKSLLNLSFAAGPLLYFYVLSFVSSSFVWKNRLLWHFLPTLMAVLFTVSYYPDIPDMQKMIWSDDFPQGWRASRIQAAVASLWFTAYACLALRLLPRYELRIRKQYSTIEAITLSWLQRILVCAAGLYALLFIFDVLAVVDVLSISAEGIGVWPRRFVQLATDISVFYMIGIAGFRHRLLHSNAGSEKEGGGCVSGDEPVSDVDVTTAQPSFGADAEKYEKSSQSLEVSAELLTLADQYMEMHRPYLNSGMQLADLAAAVGISTHEISQAINTSGSTFYDYVNGYRARMAKALLESADHDHLATQDIAAESGFASKSTFYKYFKKHFDVTPAQYRKQLGNP